MDAKLATRWLVNRMSAALHPRKVSNCVIHGDQLEIPSGGLSLTDCVLRDLPWTERVIPAFFARGCVFESCNFNKAQLKAGYFGGGEGAGFRQTIYQNCIFDGAALEGMSFGSARFERCSFRDVCLRKWLSFSAEFINCVFAGDIPEAVFLGRSPTITTPRRHNEFCGNDFFHAKFGAVEFRGGIDLKLQRLPTSGGEVILDRRTERIGRTLAAIDLWPDDAERRSAARYLRLYSGSRYEGQEQLYIQHLPSILIDEPLRQRVVSILTNCLPMDLS